MLVIKDFATTTTASALTAAATVIAVVDGSKFPSLAVGDYFYAVIQDFYDVRAVEVVKVIGVSGNELSVERGQDGTVGRAFSAGAYVELRLTVRTFAEFIAQSSADKLALYSAAGLIGTLDGRTVQERFDNIPAEVDAAGTAADLIAQHDASATAHSALSEFITQEANRAELARDAAFVNADVYPNVAAGLAAVAVGEQFQVAEGDSFVRYEHGAGGVALPVGNYPSSKFTRVTRGYTDKLIQASQHLISPAFGNTLSPDIINRCLPVNNIVVFIDPAETTRVIRSISLVSAVSTGEVQVRAYALDAGNMVFLRTLATLKVVSAGLCEYSTEDFTEFTVNAGEYLGISPIVPGSVSYFGVAMPDQLYYTPGGSSTNPFPSSSKSRVLMAFGAYEYSAQQRVDGFLDNSVRSMRNGSDLAALVTDEVEQTYGAKGVLQNSPSIASGGTLITAAPVQSFGTVDSVQLFTAIAATLDFCIFERDGNVFNKVAVKTLSVPAGLSTSAINLPISIGQYVGISYGNGVVRHRLSTGNYDGAYYVASLERRLVINTPVNTTNEFQFATRITLALPNGAGVKPWLGKTLVTFGDSITWYYGKVFQPGQAEAGDVVVGYQAYIADKFGCLINNRGLSGYAMPQIYASAIVPFDFANTFAVTLTSGANDHRKGVLPGVVLAAGSTFDTSTYAGAMQASIERMLCANPAIKIYLITPIRGYYFESGTSAVPGPYNGEMEISRDYVDVMREIGRVYGIPVVDWYDSTGVNALSYRYLLGDNVSIPYALHPRNRMFERMGKIASEQMWLYK